MYAIVKIKGKQYRVAEGDIIDVDLLDEQPGNRVEFSEVLFFDDGSSATVGAPTVSGCTVEGELLETSFGPKVLSVKYKRRKNQRTRFGHRQRYSRVKIGKISAAKAS